MDLGSALFFGFIATTVLTGIMVFAQLVGWTRIDLPLMLGSIFVEGMDRGRIVGIGVHMVTGVFFAILYAVGFALIGRSGPLLGMVFGLIHGVAALTIIVPLLPAVHPRMASERTGPEIGTELEPPGLFALNFGVATPVVTLIAHIAYGGLLGGFVGPG